MSKGSRMRIAVSLCVGSAAVSLADDAGASGLRWGHYQNVSVEQSRRVIEHAVDTATRDMGFLTRGVARRRLEEVNPPYEHIFISEQDGKIITDFEGQRYVADASGAVGRNVDPDGGKVDVSYQVERDTLHGLYKAKDGQKAIDFVFGPDERDLAVHVTVTSPRLPHPLSYVLKYTES